MIRRPNHSPRLQWIDQKTIKSLINNKEVIDRMRAAMIAYSSGECEMPIPMHLDIPSVNAEVHVKAGYRSGGRYFAVKVASSFPNNQAHSLSTGNGSMLLCSAKTGAPVAFLEDGGHLTDVRTAAVTAMVTQTLGRQDRILGILGTGIQARLQVEMHAAVLPIEAIYLWGRNAESAQECARDLRKLAPVTIADSPGEVAAYARIVICCTAARSPLLHRTTSSPGPISPQSVQMVPGKRELAPEILRFADLLLVDCPSTGPTDWRVAARRATRFHRAIEIGTFCSGKSVPAANLSIGDFTGVGVQDLYIAEYCYEKYEAMNADN